MPDIREVGTVEVEVTFPIYRKQDLSCDDWSSVIYSYVGSDMMEWSIQITRSHVRGVDTIELEVEPNVGIDPRNMDYSLGRGEYASSEDEFDAAFRRAVLFLERFGTTVPPGSDPWPSSFGGDGMRSEVLIEAALRAEIRRQDSDGRFLDPHDGLDDDEPAFRMEGWLDVRSMAKAVAEAIKNKQGGFSGMKNTVVDLPIRCVQHSDEDIVQAVEILADIMERDGNDLRLSPDQARRLARLARLGLQARARLAE